MNSFSLDDKLAGDREQTLATDRRLEFIARMTDAVIGISTLAEVAQRLAVQVRECFAVDACVIRILEGDQLVLLGAQGVPAERLGLRLPVFGLAQQILATREPVVIRDVHTHPLTKDLAPPAPDAFSFVSYAGVPLIAAGEIVGILGVYTTREPRGFTTLDVEHLRMVANHVAVGLANERLFKTVLAQKHQLEIVITERQRVEEALRERESELRQVIDLVPHSIYAKDRESRFILVNRRSAELMGTTTQEAVGKTQFELTPVTQEAEELVAEDREVMERQAPVFGREHVFTDSQGVKHVEEITKVPFTTQRTQGVAVLGVSVDITERKQAEKQLRESESRYRTLFEQSPDAIVVMDTETTLPVDFNEEACRQLGYTREEFARLRITDYEADQTPAEIQAITRDILAKGTAAFEVRHRTKQGDLRNTWVSVRTLETGGRKLFYSIWRDITERKRAEAALQESEAKFRALFESAKDGIFLLSTAGDVLALNESFARLHGYTVAEVLTLNLKDLDTPESLQLSPPRLRRLLAGEALSFEVEHYCKNGQRIPLEVSANRVVVGDETYIIGFHRDITERKRTEEALRESEDRYRLLVEESPDVIGIFRDHELVFVNSAGMQLLGAKTKAELLGRTGDQLIHPEDRLASADRVRRRQEGDMGMYPAEVRYVRLDGTAVPVEVSATPISFAGKPAVQFIARDITERQQAEERLRRQVALLDAANDAIYVRALDHTVSYWNAGAERLYGWPRAEALGRKITELGEVDPGAFAAAHAAVLERGTWSGELKVASKTGEDFFVFCRWTLLRDEQGRPAEVLAINADITENKQLEAQFLRAQRLESIGALAGGIAHDINNILTPILMTAPLLRETVSDPGSRAMLNTVERCALRGAAIIKQLLTFARGKPSARVPLPVRYLLREMDKLIRETFPRGIQPQFIAPDELWPILGDATQIHQALMNLCVNARDAMPDGGTLMLAAENLTLDAAFVARTPEAKPGDYVCVRVSDTGTGIPPENLGRIFDPFFTTKDIGMGTGLGLATVLGIVRGHDGFVRVNSQVGKGTTFELFLPASRDAKSAIPDDQQPPPPRGQGELILVVDDEPDLCSMVQIILENQGYRVVTATEGRAALALFSQHGAEIKVVLTDMMMPGMDGLALMRALRQVDGQLPIIVMTGLAERAGVKGLEGLDNPVLLTKPFAGAELLAALREVLHRPRASQPGGET